MMSIGKQRGLARLADDDGHFIMVAMDQRPPLINALAVAKGVAAAEVGFADMVAAKRLLVEGLARDATSILIDPNYAIPAAIDIIPPRTGLIVTLEEHRFVETPRGRLSRSIDNWSVEKIRRMGADAVKVLAWYRPDAAPEVRAHQEEYVRTVGAECRRHDITYVLELLVYPFPGSVNHTTAYVESGDKRADLVLESVREFAKPEYGVDLLKLETPVPAAQLPEPGDSPEARSAAAPFEEMGRICADAGIPWVLLSGGAPTDQFRRVLHHSYAAGARGFLAGRTIWLSAMRHYPDHQAVLAALRDEGLATLRAMGEVTRREAAPWRPAFDMAAIDREGRLATSYA